MIEPQKNVHISDFTNIVKWLVCLCLVFLAAVFQTSFFSASGLFSVTPDLLLSTVAAIALSGGEKKGSVNGIFAGLMAASLGGRGTLLMPLFYCLEGWVLGLMGRKLLRRNLLSWTVYMFALCSIRGAVSLMYFFFSEGSLNLPDVFAGVIIPEWLLTLIFSYFSYFIPFFASKLFGKAKNGDAEI